MIKLKDLLPEERQLGKPINQTGYTQKYIYIYRAMIATESKLLPNDYVTISKRFAVEHSDHMTAVSDELYHVMMFFVEAKYVFQTHNVGSDEYFYNGPDVKGRMIHDSKEFLGQDI